MQRLKPASPMNDNMIPHFGPHPHQFRDLSTKSSTKKLDRSTKDPLRRSRIQFENTQSDNLAPILKRN